MKNFVTLLGVALSATLYSQVIIGDANGTAATKTSVLLEFANTGDKGIILPYVVQKPTAPTEGSIILDVSTTGDARVKFYNNNASTADRWTDLSGQGATVTSVMTTQPTIAAAPEAAAAKTIIGAASSTVSDGVLVLESNTRALVLPQVADVSNIPSPSPGMLVYVNKTGAKRLAVYNGSKWSFWAPQ